MAQTALIAGVTGQDGAYLAHHLPRLGYRVVGTSRDAQMADLSRLERLGIGGDVEVVSLAPRRFVTQKIIEGVRAIQAGQARTIQLGNLEIWRDWGWAPDYVQAMVLMLQAEQPADYLIASGTTTSLRAFAQAAFAVAGLDLADHLESVEALKRPADLAYSAMDPSRIAAQLGWAAHRSVQEIVAKMYRAELY